MLEDERGTGCNVGVRAPFTKFEVTFQIRWLLKKHPSNLPISSAATITNPSPREVSALTNYCPNRHVWLCVGKRTSAAKRSPLSRREEAWCQGT